MNHPIPATNVALILALLLLVLASLAAPAVLADDGERGVTAYGLQTRPIIDGTINIYDPGMNLLSSVDRSTTNIRVIDHLASSRLILNGSNIVRHEYGPHGAVNYDISGAVYAGHPYDASRAVYQTPYRGYDPRLGRFLSLDPERQGSSPYPYAGNDPINFLDPTGSALMPFVVTSGFGPSNNFDVRVKTLMKSLGYDLDPRDATKVFGQPDQKTSMARRKTRDTLYGRSSEHTRFNKYLYWIVGDEDTIRIPGDLEHGFTRLRAWQDDFASSIVLIDTSRSGRSHLRIAEALRDIPGGRALVTARMVANRQPYYMSGQNADVTVGMRINNQGPVRDLNTFRTHVETAAATTAVVLTPPTKTSGASRGPVAPETTANLPGPSGYTPSGSGTSNPGVTAPVSQSSGVATTPDVSEFPSIMPPMPPPLRDRSPIRTSHYTETGIWRPFNFD